MAEHLTDTGQCPICNHTIIRRDNDRKGGIFVAIKSMRINRLDGSVTGECPLCRNEVELPEIKIEKTEMRKFDVNIFTKKNINKS